jgi:glycolate oxidase iron-sulfur subunit
MSPKNISAAAQPGTYNLLQPKMASTLGRRKAEHIVSTRPDIVATANIGCIMQLERYLPMPVIHIAELLDWASGGPIPAVLSRTLTRERGSSAGAAAPENNQNIGIW